MQLQIEHTTSLLAQQSCVICNQFFQPSLARVIVCSHDGEAYGDLCSTCLGKGSSFIRTNLQHVLDHDQRAQPQISAIRSNSTLSAA